MSWQARLLNRFLRLTERPALERADDHIRLRRSFERKSRFYFHAPFGTRSETTLLGDHRTLRVHQKGARTDRVILYFHGGGYVFGAPRTHAAMLARLARASGAIALLPRYPLAPEATFPSAPDAAYEIWMALLDSGVDPDTVAIGGDSAGGGLALALLGQLCAEDAPRPACVFGFSPLTDLTCSGQSVVTNADKEVILPPARVREMMTAVLDGADGDDPRASPLFAGFAGAPPIWLCVGDTEILLDDTLRMAERLRAQGASVDMIVEEDLPHVWPIFHNILPEANRTLDDLAMWLNRHWPRPVES
ncbi:MAG: alpha/beta hydrolase [Pseudomonadota bacterium]